MSKKCPVPETFGDHISKFSQIGDYISKFGQINFNPVTKYSQILTIFRDLTLFRNIVTKSFGHWTHSTVFKDRDQFFIDLFKNETDFYVTRKMH